MSAGLGKLSVCRDLLVEAAKASLGLDEYDVHFPHELALALECIDNRYDAIVVDDAQDFGEEYWLPIEMLLRDEYESTLFLFYDHNQAIYSRVSTFPIQEEPFLLMRNCRNTRHIHDAAYRYYQGEPSEAPSIIGGEVAVLDGSSRGSQVKRLQAHMVDLIDREGVDPEAIAVLLRSMDQRWSPNLGQPVKVDRRQDLIGHSQWQNDASFQPSSKQRSRSKQCVAN